MDLNCVSQELLTKTPWTEFSHLKKKKKKEAKSYLLHMVIISSKTRHKNHLSPVVYTEKSRVWGIREVNFHHIFTSYWLWDLKLVGSLKI